MITNKNELMEDKFAFLMIDFDTPELISDLWNKIPEEELYTEVDNRGNKYGREEKTHVTVVPCLDNDVSIEELKKHLKEIGRYKTILTNISLFKNENYDVLKCDAQSVLLRDTNNSILSEFPSHSEFTEYHPHVTVAYLKSGMGDKYVKDCLMPLVILQPKEFHWSYYDKDGKECDETFTI